MSYRIRNLRNLFRDTQGSIMPMLAFGILMLITAVGVAIDLSREQTLHAKLNAAMDASTLAAAKSIQTSFTCGGSNTQADVNTCIQNQVKSVGTNYFNANYANAFGGVAVTPTFNYDYATGNVIGTANASMPTTFMQMVGTNSFPVATNTLTQASIFYLGQGTGAPGSTTYLNPMTYGDPTTGLWSGTWPSAGSAMYPYTTTSGNSINFTTNGYNILTLDENDGLWVKYALGNIHIGGNQDMTWDGGTDGLFWIINTANNDASSTNGLAGATVFWSSDFSSKGGPNHSPSGTPILYLGNNGNVGINTATPAYPLDINVGSTAWSSVRLSGSGNDVAISLTNTSAAGTNNGREYWLDSGGNTAGVGAGNFSIWDNTARASRLAIDPNGNVGIGTTTPQTPLDIAGTTIIEDNSSTTTCPDSASKSVCSPRLGLVDTAVTPNTVSGSPAWYIDNFNDEFRVFRQGNITQTGYPYMVISPNTADYSQGFVGVGTQTPGCTLEVGPTDTSAKACGSDGYVSRFNGAVSIGTDSKVGTLNSTGWVDANIAFSGSGGQVVYVGDATNVTGNKSAPAAVAGTDCSYAKPSDNNTSSALAYDTTDNIVVFCNANTGKWQSITAMTPDPGCTYSVGTNGQGTSGNCAATCSNANCYSDTPSPTAESLCTLSYQFANDNGGQINTGCHVSGPDANGKWHLRGITGNNGTVWCGMTCFK